jgi:hypothetical protein
MDPQTGGAVLDRGRTDLAAELFGHLGQLGERRRLLVLGQGRRVEQRDERVVGPGEHAGRQHGPLRGKRIELGVDVVEDLTPLDEVEPTRTIGVHDHVCGCRTRGLLGQVPLERLGPAEIERLDLDPRVPLAERLEDRRPLVGARVAIDHQRALVPARLDDGLDVLGLAGAGPARRRGGIGRPGRGRRIAPRLGSDAAAGDEREQRRQYREAPSGGRGLHGSPVP